MDVIPLAIGFTLGVVLVVIAIEMGLKKTSRETPASKHTNKWSIDEITNPKIMAEYFMDADIPKNSKVIVNQYKDKNLLQGLNAKSHKGIKGNYIIGEDRALIIAGPLKKDELGIWTVEKEIVEKLNEEFDRMWSKSSQMKFDEEK